MDENSISYVRIEDELEDLKAYGVLAYALIKEVARSGGANDGSDQQAALVIQRNITALCDRIADKLNEDRE